MTSSPSIKISLLEIPDLDDAATSHDDSPKTPETEVRFREHETLLHPLHVYVSEQTALNCGIVFPEVTRDKEPSPSHLKRTASQQATTPTPLSTIPPLTPDVQPQLRCGVLSLAHHPPPPLRGDQPPKGLFVNFKVSSQKTLLTNVVYVQSAFLRHYQLDPGLEYTFRLCLCPPLLDRVVLGAKNAIAFQWMKHPNWFPQLTTLLRQKQIVCRRGDMAFFHSEDFAEALLAPDGDAIRPQDVITVDCTPSFQGVMDTNTKIIVTLLSEERHSRPSTEVLQSKILQNDGPTKSGAKEDQFDRPMDAYLNLINYASRLMFRTGSGSGSHVSSSAQSAPLIKSFAISSAALNMYRNWSFKVQIEPKPFCYDYVTAGPPTASFEGAANPPLALASVVDTHCCLYVTKEAMHRLASQEGDWLYVKLLSEVQSNPRTRRVSSLVEPPSSTASPSLSCSTGAGGGATERMSQSVSLIDLEEHGQADELDFSPDSSSWRLVQIRSSPPKYDAPPDIVQLTPQLWFNLNSQPSLLVQPETKIVVKKTSQTLQAPLFAEEVYLALVQSPDYSSSLDFYSILLKYFSTSNRYLCKGDLLAISSRDNVRVQESQEDVHNFRWPTIFFYVSRLEGSSGDSTLTPGTGYRVDFPRTRLYQMGTIQCYVPVTMSTFLSPAVMHQVWRSPLPPSLTRIVHKLNNLITPVLTSKKFREQVPATVLLTGPPHCGKTLSVEAVCRSLNLHLYSVNCQELVGETSGASEAKLKIIANRALTFAPCVLLLQDISALLKDAQGEDHRTIFAFCQTLTGLLSSGELPVVVIGTAPSSASVHPDILPAFLHSLKIPPPDENERLALLDSLLGHVERSANLDLFKLAQRTKGLVVGDLTAVVNGAIQNAYSRCKRKCFDLDPKNSELKEEALSLAGFPVTQQDLTTSLEKLLNTQAQAIGAPKIPNVRWQDVGGLESVKREILDTVQLPLEHPELLQAGLRRSGLLLHGPPGTGKTLLAKAVATECSLNFLSVKGPELINMYVGQSEENIREVFSRARLASPCIIFFDELDSLAPNRGHSGDSGGVMDRVVSQLLAELDGLHRSADVFVMGATNRPDLLDPALLRPGRFDRLVFVGLPETSEERIRILSALTRKMTLSEDVNLEEVERASPSGLSGADLYAICSDAQTNALARCIHQQNQLQRSSDEGQPPPDIGDKYKKKSGIAFSSNAITMEVTMDDFRLVSASRMIH